MIYFLEYYQKVYHILAQVFLIVSFTILIPLVSFGQQPNKVVYIKHGSSFGECGGYCIHETTFSPEGIDKHVKAWESQKNKYSEKSQKLKIKALYWHHLINTINFEQINKLPRRIGCPDCTDGGSEWVEIATINKKYYIIFEYGSEIKEMKELLLYLRKQEIVSS